MIEIQNCEAELLTLCLESVCICNKSSNASAWLTAGKHQLGELLCVVWYYSEVTWTFCDFPAELCNHDGKRRSLKVVSNKNVEQQV